MDSLDIGLPLLVAIVVLGTLINYFDRGTRSAALRERPEREAPRRSQRRR